MKARLSRSEILTIVGMLSRLVYFAKADDVHSMSSCFSTLVDRLYGSFFIDDTDSSDVSSDDSQEDF